MITIINLRGSEGSMISDLSSCFIIIAHYKCVYIIHVSLICDKLSCKFKISIWNSAYINSSCWLSSFIFCQSLLRTYPCEELMQSLIELTQEDTTELTQLTDELNVSEEVENLRYSNNIVGHVSLKTLK